jgi:hypothetical protein
MREEIKKAYGSYWLEIMTTTLPISVRLHKLLPTAGVYCKHVHNLQAK